MFINLVNGSTKIEAFLVKYNKIQSKDRFILLVQVFDLRLFFLKFYNLTIQKYKMSYFYILIYSLKTIKKTGSSLRLEPVRTINLKE